MSEVYKRMISEYEQAAEIVYNRIKSRRAELKTLPPYSKRTMMLRNEISTLYAERRDAIEAVNAMRAYA